jgi:UDP-N-acetylglucosamine 2-epimerase (non-hydrolysing)
MNILICFGTRPEYIKVKSLIDNLNNVKTLFTGQHVDLVKDNNIDYKIRIDNDCGNRLNDVVCSVLNSGDIFRDVKYVLVQGDTTSALAIALSAFHHKKKVIHLEAGLRTNDMNDPFPEEMNRQLISRIASINLCPTTFNRDNLLKENVQGSIHVTGNTGLDNIDKTGCTYGNKVLVTMHRRDNHLLMGQWFQEISHLANKYTDLEFIIPLHPNPNVQKHRDKLKGVTVIDPLPHNELVEIMKRCRLAISDSGGLQEELSFLNKKIIVCRRTTERPETVGKHSVMCSNPINLESMFDRVYNNYEIDAPCPYGDGNSWKKIKEVLERLE